MKEKLENFFGKYRGNPEVIITDCVIDILDIMKDITGGIPLSMYITKETSKMIAPTDYLFYEDLLTILTIQEHKNVSMYLSIIDNNEKAVSKTVIKSDLSIPLSKEILVLLRVMPLQEVINLIDILTKIKMKGKVLAFA